MQKISAAVLELLADENHPLLFRLDAFSCLGPSSSRAEWCLRVPC
jgi:hypothetical protein